MRATVVVTWLAGLMLGLAGCTPDDPLGRLPITGSVTFKGQPLEQGSIRFSPLDPKAKLTATGGQISGGRYSIPQNQGLPPGIYKVEVSHVETVGEAPADPMNAPAQQGVERIPPKYNANTGLTAEVQSGKDNSFDFDLKES